MREELRIQIQSQLDMMVKASDNRIAYKYDEGFINLHLLVPPNCLSKNNKPVKKLSLWLNPEGYNGQPVHGEDLILLKARLSLTYDDGSKEAFSFAPQNVPVFLSMRFVLAFYKMLVEAGAEMETAFLHQSTRPVVDDWTRIRLDYIQQPLVFLYETKSRTAVAQYFADTLKLNGDLLEKAQTHGVQVFSFGCGDGADIKKVNSMLRKQLNLKTTCFGLDIDPKYSEKMPSDVAFEQLDINHLDNWLPHKANSQALKLGIFMSSLNEMVMPSSFAALKCLHQVRDFDIVVVGGYTPVLLAKSHFKAAGWNVTLKETNSAFETEPSTRIIRSEQGLLRHDNRSHYILTPMTDEQRCAYLQKRAIRRSSAKEFNCLDLSCSSNPLHDLELFGNYDCFKLVDISWCRFTQEDFEAFVNKLDANLTKPINFIAAGDEIWFKQFEQISSPKFNLIQRLDHKTDELAPYAPATALRIGVRKETPYVGIVKKGM